MNIKQIENENAVELIADIIEPFSKIAADAELVEMIRKGENLKAVQHALRNHKTTVVEILAALNQTPVEDFHCNIITITRDLLELLNDKELIEVFTQ